MNKKLSYNGKDGISNVICKKETEKIIDFKCCPIYDSWDYTWICSSFFLD